MFECFMHSIWDSISAELSRLHRTDAWLAKRLSVGRNTISGWKTRGVPAARYDEIAQVLGWSLERLVYGEDAPAAVVPFDGDLSPMAIALGKEFDDIENEQQRMRCYALALQIFSMGGSMPAASNPKQPEQTTPALAPQSTHARQ